MTRLERYMPDDQWAWMGVVAGEQRAEIGVSGA